MTALQASLIFKSCPSHVSSSNRVQLSLHTHRRRNSLSSALPFFTLDSASLKPRFRRHRLLFNSTLHPDNVSSSSSSDSTFSVQNSIPDLEESQVGEIFNEFLGMEAEESASVGEEIGRVGSEVESDTKSENSLEKGNARNRLPVVVFLLGLLATARKGFDKLSLSNWFAWWPFWQQEKLLERLIEEADAHPQDAAKQSALLSELNKHSPEAVISRFEERDHAVDSRAVAEYIRALVATDAIDEYLPDEQSGKPSSLPTLLQELKHRASGNMDEPCLSPGVSEKQPLHVLMVDPKVSNRSSRFAQELISTILFTVAVGLVWVLGAAALQKYIGSLGGMGTSGVGSSSSYSPKELNKEIMPEKVERDVMVQV